ncbi:hypothetical protein E4M02_12485 [Brevundimonas sp. S30B]|uniref:hypothetical protein n=1 Tax=unclassified Brevundimonas TaxID=2622653 RepID=UPI00107297E8|nr:MULTISPECIES: hypothetical protein [unclassified Brevundimonas]QBX36374.1 hypothetical protein E4M01_00545 [Brevundimonas sp. MF30-B]TFW01083.1 hypothetical protein E4M02_12485 [Brevundimonas sp. S30B]
MRPHAIALAVMLGLGACGDGDAPSTVSPAAPGPAGPSAGPSTVAANLPGAGPANFVGRWAANVEWCAAPRGDQQPINITTTRFEGYENACDITRIDQRDGGYEAALACVAEGMTSNERVRMVVNDQVMTLTYLDRGRAQVALTRCTTLADTPRVSAAPDR